MKIRISIHAPARGATDDRESIQRGTQISIHAPARGATKNLWAYGVHEYISIHAPARGATPVSTVLCRDLFISIHAPARGATSCRFLFRCSKWNFNPRSREGSDKNRVTSFFFGEISIHAPARGATPDGNQTLDRGRISIHAPARGATKLRLLPEGNARFQSTLPRGERRMLDCDNSRTINISIHAPARGATLP